MVQLGMVFTAGQAIRAGKTEAWIRHAIRQERLVRIRRGLYCDAELWRRSGESALARHVLEARAAWIALGRRGWASHYSAALLDGQERVASAGDVLHFPAHMRHGATMLDEEVVLVDIFSPIREDFLPADRR